MNVFALSTPDLSINPFIDVFSENFAHVVCSAQIMVGLNTDDSLEPKVGTLESNVAMLHKEILADVKRAWYQPLPDSFNLLDNQNYQKQLRSIFDELNTEDNLIIHDPLLCRFLPLYVSLDAHSVVLLHYSEPLECASVLQKKWRFPLSVGLALWESYIFDAVKNIAADKCVLLSSKKCRNSGKRHLKSVIKNLEKITAGELDLTQTAQLDPVELVGVLPADYSELLEHVQSSQSLIFDALEKGNLSTIKKLNISKQSADILDYYGRIRAGFEMMKGERDQQKNELAIAQQQVQNLVENINTDITNSGPNLEEVQNSQQQNLIAVKVGLRGMPAVEFLSEPNSPILEMLQKHLLTNKPEQDEMIYLNSVGTDNEAMYFMASSLLTIETQSVSQH